MGLAKRHSVAIEASSVSNLPIVMQPGGRVVTARSLAGVGGIASWGRYNALGEGQWENVATIAVNRPFNCGLLSSYHSSSLQ
jgi:hypothetical protein